MFAERNAALRRVRTAMGDFPFAVGGTASFDSALIARSEGRAIGKIGAEGMYGLAIPALGIGIAIKVIDGNQRPIPIVVDRVLARFEVNAPELHDALRPFFGEIDMRFGSVTPVRDAYSRDTSPAALANELQSSRMP